ncbi:N-acetylglutamate synthase, GNAT family [Gracilibacillus orientalis]|uniref:N-acetylglutamate synthase, GNAT family n=1 Tax=Gracilibacillus orientalis TaxID=334253 RepID=A0A1I4HDV9_9BACI|nr:GNAT family N-acetyltransferase [Gracilibacillus orientalis]SFL40412.1 N-acetylglutamate synthase, GNAT family [Gracilibacillus orientalis]
MEWYHNNFVVSDDKELLDLDIIYNLLKPTYWANDRSKETIKQSIENSFSFGVYIDDKQMGFARVVTDQAVFSWILDVVIDPEYQGRGVGSFLMQCILEHPALKNTKFALATKDAQPFYEAFNFTERPSMVQKLVKDEW